MDIYLNTNLIDLEGEIWKDIKGYEFYHQVSNLGRVKTLDRVIPHPRLNKQFVKGRVLKQKIVIDKNTITNEGMVSLQVALCRENNIQYVNVRRLVYDTFVKSINFKKDGLYVINKNGDGFNNRLENLILVTKKEKSQRSFQRGRVPESHLKTVDRSLWKDKIYGGKANRKKVAQLNLDELSTIKIFESITKAAKVTGFDSKEIINTAKGRKKSYKGYGWKYVN